MERPPVEPSGHRDAVFGLAERDGRVLLVSNPRVIGGTRRDVWDLPGGAIRSGESLEDGLVREWREETGLAVGVGALRLVVDGAKRTPGGALLYTWRAFVFRVACDGDPVPGEGIVAAAWVPRDEAVRRLDAPYHEHLRAVLGEDAGAGAARAGVDPGTRYERLTWVEDGADAAPSSGLPMRRLLVIAAAAAAGDPALLARELDAARDDAEVPQRIVETLLQIVPYAGYPRAITAFGVLRATMPDAPPAEEAEIDRSASAVRGRGAFAAVYGETAQAVLEGLTRLDPVLARWTLEHAYGRVLARQDALSLRERELLAVAILTALGGLEDPLLGHMRACVRLGCEPGEVAAAIDCVPAAVGEARRDAARRLLGRLRPRP